MPLNFLQLSNFPEIAFQSHVTTSGESKTESLAVGLGDGEAEPPAGARPVSGTEGKQGDLAPIPGQPPAGSGTSAGCAETRGFWNR